MRGNDYFQTCFTTEEVKARYRQLAMKLHPDKGGNEADFRELNQQYEHFVLKVAQAPDLPDIFSVDKDYEYFRSKIIYKARNNHWYIFDRPSGAAVYIDSGHTNLIWEKSRTIVQQS